MKGAPSTHRAPGHARSALLIVDMINRFDFDGGSALLRQCTRSATNILRLRDGFARKGWPVIYCNDNFGQWRSDFRAVYDCCARADSAGAAIATLLRPGPGDYFILKPKNSAFFSTPLELLLRSLRVRQLVITGIAGDGCVLATATDANIRDYQATVVSDATASQSVLRNRRAMTQLADTKVAEIVTTVTLLRRLARR